MPSTSAPTPPPSRRQASRADGLPPAFWNVAFPGIVVLLGLMIPLLGWAGAQIVLDSTDGNLSQRVRDPAAPGYEAVVEPTPTLLVLHVRDDVPVGAAVLALTGDDAGGAILLSADTVVERDGVRVTVADAYAQGGVEEARSAAEQAIGVQVGGVAEVDDGRWADLLGPVGTLTVQNTDDVVGDGEVLFAAGEVELSPGDVGLDLGERVDGADEVNRLLRYEDFWRAWLTAIGGSGASAPPGEGEGGPGWFVAEVARRDWSVVTLPADPLPIPGTPDVLFVPISAEVDDVVAELVPFPVGAPPGSRLRVRILDGTGELDRGLPFAEAVVAGGGEVAVIGNASSFDVATTQIQLTDPAQRDQAEELRASLGVGEIVEAGASGGSDVTVVLGRDALAVVGATGG